MTSLLTPRLPQQQTESPRFPRTRHYLLCRPDHFAVTYAINPWMDLTVPVDLPLALAQWEQLRATYERLGHTVDVLEPVPGLPDMVFAANGGTVVGGRSLRARFTHPEREPEAAAYAEWLEGVGEVGETVGRNEGEGDLLVVGDLILAGTGFRTDLATHAEVQEFFGLPVVSLQLVDPHYYHLDTALAVLDDHTIAYLPSAFSDGSRAALERLFPDAVLATPHDAALLGLNAVSDGHHVVMAAGADDLAAQLRERGFEPVPVELSELRKAGGGAKCCTLEIRQEARS